MKKLQSIFLLFLSMILLAGCVNIPLGDGNKLKITKKGVVFTDADGEERSVTIDEENDSISFSGFGEDGEEGFSFGQNLEIPDSLPSDIPIPKNPQVYQASHIQGTTNVGLATEMSKADVEKMYEKHFKSNSYVGEVETAEINEDDDEGFTQKSYFAKRDGAEVRIFVTDNTDYVDVHIMYQEKNEEDED